jgi:pimeloyl-ACP methyl ester carboxylesterase
MELFTTRGYHPVLAPGWPDEPATVQESRARPEALANWGTDDVVAYYRDLLSPLPARPILVGHSFGGTIAEKLLDMDTAAAAIAINAERLDGLLPLPLSALRATLLAFRDPANMQQAVSLTAEEFRYSFGNALAAAESDALFAKWAIPAPGRPLLEAMANPPSVSPAVGEIEGLRRGPLLLVVGGRDHPALPAFTKSILAQYRHCAAVTDLIAFPHGGHSLTIDRGWPRVAASCLRWLRNRGFAPT